MPERTENDQGKLHISSDFVPCETLYDLFIVLITHATNMQILMADPMVRPYYHSLQIVHEDLVWAIGILELAFGITPGEVIEYSNERRESGAFEPMNQDRDTAKDHHERMFG